MKIRLWHWYKDRNKQADDLSANAEAVRQRVEAQWPEVRRHVKWARDARQRNHLTDLFFDLRGGHS